MRSLATLALISAFLLGVTSCKRAPPAPVKYDAYTGNAYPNLRAKVPPITSAALLVPNAGQDSLSLVDVSNDGHVIATAPVGRNPFLLDSPHHVVGNRARGVAFVALAYPPQSEKPGVHSHGKGTLPGWIQEVSLEDFRPIGEIRTDPNPGEIALSEDFSKLVVTHFDLKAASSNKPIGQRRATIAVIDPAKILPFNSPEPDKLLVCAAPHGVSLSRPDGKRAYVACYGEDALAIVNLENRHEPVVRIALGAGEAKALAPGAAPEIGPYSAVLSPSGNFVALGCNEAHDVRIVDVRSREKKQAISLPGAAYIPAWTEDERALYVPVRERDGLARVSLDTGEVTAMKTFAPEVCTAPHEALLSQGGTDASKLYLLCEGDGVSPGTIVTLDPNTMDERAHVSVGKSPGRAMLIAGPP